MRSFRPFVVAVGREHAANIADAHRGTVAHLVAPSTADWSADAYVTRIAVPIGPPSAFAAATVASASATAARTRGAGSARAAVRPPRLERA